MSRLTQTLNNSARLLTNTNIPAYTLQYLNDSIKHPAGSFETIVMPYIEIGREGTCAIRFGEDQPFVSRKHIALERKANAIYIKILATTNPVLLNGRPVQDGQKIENGNIIQLAYEGPKLKFNINANGTANLGITNRIKLLSQQALRPYRMAIAAISTFTLSSLLGLGYVNYSQSKEIVQQRQDMEHRLDSSKVANEKAIQEILKKYKLDKNQMESRIRLLVDTKQPKKPRTVIVDQIPTSTDGIDNDQIYYLSVTEVLIESEGETKSLPIGGWSGTGFLLDNGQFVTARHVVQPWRFSLSDSTMFLLNQYEQAGGHIIVKFKAYSSKNTIELSSDVFVKNDKYDRRVASTDDHSMLHAENYATDWAYATISSRSSSMESNDNASVNLTQGETVKIIGFPLGLALQESHTLKSVYSEAKVSQNGLVRGLIAVSNMSIEHGNSGGPVFAERNGKWVVVGIVSSGISKFGFIVPISNLKINKK
jgi:pSer/pThr/pTyr-binding forkhead associated (FHA) protein